MAACATYGIYFMLFGLFSWAVALLIYARTSPGRAREQWVTTISFLGLVMVAAGAFLWSQTRKEGFRMLVDPATGRRDRSYRPYIDQEETTRYMTIYNPNVPYHSGLYDQPHQQPIPRFEDHYRRRQRVYGKSCDF